MKEKENRIRKSFFISFLRIIPFKRIHLYRASVVHKDEGHTREKDKNTIKRKRQ